MQSRSQRALALVGPGRAGTTVAAALGGARLDRGRGRRTQLRRAVDPGRGRPARCVEDRGGGRRRPRRRPGDRRHARRRHRRHRRRARPLPAGRCARRAPLGRLPASRSSTSCTRPAPTCEVGCAAPAAVLAVARGRPRNGSRARGARWRAPRRSNAWRCRSACARSGVAPGDRARYHAAATIASNHLVALLGQAARVADAAGVPPEALLPLVRASVDNVDALGAGRRAHRTRGAR